MVVKTGCGFTNISRPRHGSDIVIRLKALKYDMAAKPNSPGSGMITRSKEFTIFSIFLIIF